MQYAAAASIFNVNRWTNRDLLLVAPLAKKYYVYRPADLFDNIATSIVVPAHIAAAAQIDQSYLLDGAIVDPCPVHGSSGPPESASPQTVPRSVHPFSQGYPSAQRTQTTERATSVAILLYFIASVYFLFVVYTFCCHIRC